MSVVISSDLVLSGAESTLSLDHPIIGWKNLITRASLSADLQDSLNPVTNLANPATFNKWKSTATTNQNIVFTTGTASLIDYIAIARHNLATAGATCRVIANGVTDITTPIVLSDNGPALFRFTAQSLSTLTLRIESSTIVPEIAVMYAGKLLVVERRIYAAHTPMPDGRVWTATNGMSESGQFLGRIVLSEFVKSKIPLQLLTPAWYRANFRPFLLTAKEAPFFFAWRPQTYPNEIGYGWLTNMPAQLPTAPSNLSALNLEVTGVV